MNRIERHCCGCNERFMMLPDEYACPQCSQSMHGAESPITVHLADTVDITEEEKVSGGEFDLSGRILSNYHVDQLLGQGGMARVYEATHLTLHRPCALKILSRNLIARNKDYIDMFITEARNAAALIHPNVVTVHNIGSADEYHFIELEYVPGRSLQNILQEIRRFPPMRATALLVQACSALAEAHSRGMVHRDFKPSNILVTLQDVAKLADFGLAKRIASGESSSSGITGTPYFMAPELFEGHEADKTTDVYAAGIAYFYMLTGQLPFRAKNVAELAELHKNQPIPDPCDLCEEIPANASHLITRALAKDAADRYPDASELLAALNAVLCNLRDGRTLVSEALAGTDITWEELTDRFVAVVTTKDGRTQRVFIEDNVSGPITDHLIRVYSVCAAATDSYNRRALELNASIPYGSLALENLDGDAHFVMMHSYPRATCDPEELRLGIEHIGQWADHVEHALTGTDRH